MLLVLLTDCALSFMYMYVFFVHNAGCGTPKFYIVMADWHTGYCVCMGAVCTHAHNQLSVCWPPPSVMMTSDDACRCLLYRACMCVAFGESAGGEPLSGRRQWRPAVTTRRHEHITACQSHAQQGYILPSPSSLHFTLYVHLCPFKHG